MFEDALLESFPQRSVLSRIHYLIAALTGVLVFALGIRLATTLLAPAGERALVTGASLLGRCVRTGKAYSRKAPKSQRSQKNKTPPLTSTEYSRAGIFDHPSRSDKPEIPVR